MATQRLTLATLAGDAGRAVSALFRAWRSTSAVGVEAAPGLAIDELGERLRSNGAALPVVYFCEWIDRWLMGDQVPGPGVIAGRRFQASCMSPEEAVEWAGRCGGQFPEQLWLAARLREAAEAWRPAVGPSVVVVLREVLGASSTDEEVLASLHGVPLWLSHFGGRLGGER
jgi:hypothetical protein